MVFVRYFGFWEFFRMVCQQIPEAEPQKVYEYLKEHAPPPYGWDTVNHWARKIETMMIDEGGI